MKAYLFLLVGAILLSGGCSHQNNAVRQEPDTGWVADTADADVPGEGVRLKGGNSVSARIWVLINNGQFAEAEALIAEAKASGLIAAPMATRMMDRITLLNMKLGQIPATLQRAPDFPTQLKDYTLFEIIKMQKQNDFSLATKLQLKMVKKLLEQPERLMGKL
ncbi:hypothetical protein JQX13_22890 [Archangium violaceum]|uniref:hypothetical protein n=1 Tax=Archangium violaceum TaxID=83451 RepID=UPI00193BA886|nr:hypothetical protein [Archangium violaceum]QRK12624.1 hypothetical protein JQX13_22890 [Archangium violaceum]